MTIIYFLYAYLAIGFVFGVFFIFKGAEIIHQDIKGAGLGLKLLLLPASVLLWPYLLRKVIQKK